MEEKSLDRRTFLTKIGTGAAALAVATSGLGILSETANAKSNSLLNVKPKKNGFKFTPIKATAKDELVLPKGFKYDVVAAYGDVINRKGDTFGFNNDFTLYFPINNSSKRGLLWVNHEYSNPLYVEGANADDKYTPAQIEKMLYNLGGSIIEVYYDKKANKWKMDPSSTYARRVSGLTTFTLTGPAKGSKAVNGATSVQGTFANCSGGKTLWNTVLSCEENFEEPAMKAGLNQTHYGWVIEVDPFNPKFTVRKHTALGRFNHENASMGLSKDHRVVVYMGDDKKDACVYKFVSKHKYVPSLGKKNSRLLEEGTLYVADLQNGKWIALTIDAVKKAAAGKPDLLEKFQTQADVLTYCQEAAILLGGTPTDRPEDVEISPFDHTIFIAHTNNDKHGNLHGHITRIFEKNGDHGATEFEYEIFAAGGRQSGFSAPDNLTFDSNANLWTVTDISSSKLNTGAWTKFKNNGMFVIPTVGPDKGIAKQFASAPVEAELTGPCFAPDEQTLFLSVQHPGEETEDIKNPTSTWPHRKGEKMPRPAVVAITGFKF
ncbi:PhoX family protein [Niallia sp. 01092]|uniref:PhoX family protein n=1 Tax=unclassified Niallia TaxID=2837522 RepID=UPI003FD25AE1